MLRKEEGEGTVSETRNLKFSKELHKAYPVFCFIARTNSQQIFLLACPSEGHFQHVHFTQFLKVPIATEPPVHSSNLLINEPLLAFLSSILHLFQGTQTKEDGIGWVCDMRKVTVSIVTFDSTRCTLSLLGILPKYMKGMQMLSVQ